MAKPTKRNCYICAKAGEDVPLQAFGKSSIAVCDDCMKRHRLRTELRSDAAPLTPNWSDSFDLHPL